MTEGPTSQPAGWYPEPGTGQSRYWDGAAWGPYASQFGGGSGSTPRPAKDKVAAGILGILLGAFGVHKFYLGYTTSAVIMLVGSIFGMVLSCLWIPVLVPFAFSIIGLVEGIIYLTKSDGEFQVTYVQGTKEWF